MHVDILKREGRWYWTRWEEILVIKDNQQRLEALVDLLIEMRLCPPRSDSLHRDALDRLLESGAPKIMQLFRTGPCTSWTGVTETDLNSDWHKWPALKYEGKDPVP